MSRSTPRCRAHHLDRIRDDGEVGQSEQIDLEQPDLRDAVHVVLRHGGAVTGGRALQRNDVGERLGADHHARGVRRRVAADPLEAAGVVDDVPRPVLVLVELAELTAAR